MKLILDQLIPGFALLGFCPGLFALGGCLVAVGLYWLVPGYYPGIYPAWMDYVAIPAAVGQGFLFGLAVGVMLVIGLGCFRQLEIAPIARALRLVAICGVLFATIGMGIGFGVGTFNPNYYQKLFNPDKMHQDFRPVDVGMGLGCTEGLVIGLFAGAFAAVGTAWHRKRRARPVAADLDHHPYDQPMPAEPL
jgi:hypothetical protein